MVPLCTFVRPTGKTCGSPAVRGQQHCYYHNPSRRPSGPRRPTTRPGYRWYSFYRKVAKLRPEEAVPVWCELVDAAIKREIPRAMLFKILNRYNLRVAELGARLHQDESTIGAGS